MAWSGDGERLASGSYDKTVRVWDVESSKTLRVLEGHTRPVTHSAWSADSQWLTTVQEDGAGRIWRMADGAVVAESEPLPFHVSPAEVAFATGPPKRLRFDDDGFWFEMWSPAGRVVETVEQLISAKVVLTGDSNVGKTSLAMQLRDRRHEVPESTHGMQIWTMSSEKLYGDAVPPEGERWEVFLWDLGGQPEYQLVHQLFLHDTKVALTLFCPERGDGGLEAAREWSHRLDQQASKGELKKLLVRPKIDLPGPPPDRHEVEALEESCEFSPCIEVSSTTGDNFDNLRAAIHTAIDWNNLPRISRDEAFQAIRNVIDKSREAEQVLLYEKDLRRQLADGGVDYTDDQLKTVTKQLVDQGQIVDVEIGPERERVIVLRLDKVECYAGSMILAARERPRGVPALEQRLLLSPDMEFPKMGPKERLGRGDEKVVLQAVIELMLEHGLCMRHGGLLIFPTIFPKSDERSELEPEHRVPLYYEFKGAISNLYAGTVSMLALSEEFGRVRLFPNRAEYEQAGDGVFGIQRTDPQRGSGRLDVYFSDDATEARRELFVKVIEEHLSEQGVKIRQGLMFQCPSCKTYKLEEDTLRAMLDKGRSSVTCPICDTVSSLFGGTGDERKREDEVQAIRFGWRQRVKEAVADVTRTMSEGAKRPSKSEPLRILHLSDLHLQGGEGDSVLLTPLLLDLDVMKAKRIEYLVVSGDLADRCSEAGFEQAVSFLLRLVKELNLSTDRMIVVPGNHDYDQNVEVYSVEKSQPRNSPFFEGDVMGKKRYFVQDPETYPKRFDRFRNAYKQLTQQDYPLDPNKQARLFHYDETGIQFLSLNSAWEVDEYFPERASLHGESLSSGILEARKKEAQLRIAVWHHAVYGERKISNENALELLGQAGFSFCLHGDVHEQRREAQQHFRTGGEVNVIGAGTFSSEASGLPAATPRLYTLLEVDRGFTKVDVVTRAQSPEGGAFDAFAVWPASSGSPHERSGSYTVDLKKAAGAPG